MTDKTTETKVAGSYTTPTLTSPGTVEVAPGRTTSEFLLVVLAFVLGLLDQTRLYLEGTGEPSLVGLGAAIAAGWYAHARAKVKSPPTL